MPKPILVPVDGSALAEQALPYAQVLAEPAAPIILLVVGQVEDDLSLRERHADSSARLETAVGDPAEQILRVAQERDVALIVMTTHGRGAIGRWAFGSVADQVTRTSPVPVLVVRPRPGANLTVAPTIHRLIVPLDGTLLAEAALPVALSLATRLQVPIHLVTVIDPAGLTPLALATVAAVDAELFEDRVARLRGDAEAVLAEPDARLRQAGVVTSWEVLHGSPGPAITDAVQPGDLIVLTSHGHSGIKRLLLGSVAEKLIREGPVPVILVPAADDLAGATPSDGVGAKEMPTLGG